MFLREMLSIHFDPLGLSQVKLSNSCFVFVFVFFIILHPYHQDYRYVYVLQFLTLDAYFSVAVKCIVANEVIASLTLSSIAPSVDSPP